MKRLLAGKNFVMFIKFSCVGVLNTIIDSAIFFVLCDLAGINEVFSNVFSYLIAATNSYFLNSRFVYKEKKYEAFIYLKFLSANIIILVISTILVTAFSKFTEFKIIAKLITILPVTVLNFLIQRFMIFKKSADKILTKKRGEGDEERMDA